MRMLSILPMVLFLLFYGSMAKSFKMLLCALSYRSSSTFDGDATSHRSQWEKSIRELWVFFYFFYQNGVIFSVNHQNWKILNKLTKWISRFLKIIFFLSWIRDYECPSIYMGQRLIPIVVSNCG